MDSAKALVTSKTFLLAILQAAIAVIIVFETSYPGAGWLLGVKSILDIVLRIYTVQPIGSFIRDPQ